MSQEKKYFVSHLLSKATVMKHTYTGLDCTKCLTYIQPHCDPDNPITLLSVKSSVIKSLYVYILVGIYLPTILHQEDVTILPFEKEKDELETVRMHNAPRLGPFRLQAIIYIK